MLSIIDEILDIDLHGGLPSEIVEWDGVSIHHPQIHDPGIQYEPFCIRIMDTGGHIVPSSTPQKAFMPYWAMHYIGLNLIWKLHILG
jgi:hypothetical protein